MAVHMHAQLNALRPRGSGQELELVSLGGGSKDPLDEFQVCWGVCAGRWQQGELQVCVLGGGGGGCTGHSTEPTSRLDSQRRKQETLTSRDLRLRDAWGLPV